MTGTASMAARRLAITVSLLMSGCSSEPPPVPGPPQLPFEEVAAATGLQFTHFNGASGGYYQPEIFGPGIGLLDYDGDGDLDVYLPQATMVDPDEPVDKALFPLPAGHPPGDRLFRNELIPGGELRFTDVTEAAGLGHAGYAQGVATGDFDNDGHVDLYVTAFGSNVLYHNRGDGRFTDVTATGGVDDPRWSTSAAFLDYDRDGDLDLYACNYLRWSPEDDLECSLDGETRSYCEPRTFTG
ncbi:MAG: VCBS repeat-containing protein, partial [Thiohalobacterales bacterium]|nr:VCBS repeat-containing protein [Thiohalobacterales bacterium]